MRKTLEWEKILAYHISDKLVGSRIHIELSKINNKKTNNLVKKKRGMKWLKYFTKKIYKIICTYIKRCSILSVVREMQIKTRMDCHYTPMVIAKIWKTNCTKYWQRYGRPGFLIHKLREWNGENIWKVVSPFLKNLIIPWSSHFTPR